MEIQRHDYTLLLNRKGINGFYCYWPYYKVQKFKTLSNVKCFILQTIQFISSVIKVWSRFLFYIYFYIRSSLVCHLIQYLNTIQVDLLILYQVNNIVVRNCNLANGMRKLLKGCNVTLSLQKICNSGF